MTWLRVMAQRLRGMYSRRRRDADFDEELRAHLEMLVEENLQRGLPPQEARRAARVALGGAEQIKEAVREQRGLPFIESLAQDLRFGLRMLRKNPGFTATAVLTLALGIGANTAIFTLIDAVILRSLPVSDPSRLVSIGTQDRLGRPAGLSLAVFQSLARNQTVFSGLFAWDQSYESSFTNLEVNGAPTTGSVLGVSGDYYSTLGVAPLIGRLIEPSDVDLSAQAPNRVAVLGYDFWRRSGGDASILGTTIRIEDVPFTVIGVTRPGFTGMRRSAEDAATIPLTAQALISPRGVGSLMTHPGTLWLGAIARLKPGVTAAQARAQLESIWPGIRAATDLSAASPRTRDFFLASRIDLQPAGRGFDSLRTYAQPLYATMAIAALILLIAAVNLAGLLLARATSRGHELAIRAALGAGRLRLARQFILEALLLSLSGAALGVLFAAWASRLLTDFLTRGSSVLDVSPDFRVLGFASLLAVATAVLFSLAAAWRAARQDPDANLRQRASVSARLGRAGKLLIVTQIALSVVLVMVSALFVRSLEKLRAVPLGFQDKGVLNVALTYVPHGSEKMQPDAYYPQLVARVGSLPGVTSASIAKNAPYSLLEWRFAVAAEGQAPRSTQADWAAISPGFFTTVRMNLLAGRDFTWQDGNGAPAVAILDESLAAAVFPGENPVGRSVRIGTDPADPPARIVGVVSDARVYGSRQAGVTAVYVPYLQQSFGYPNLLVRTSAAPDALAPFLRREVESFGYEFPARIENLSVEAGQVLLQDRLVALLAAFFGALALLLAVVGVFGLMSYSVAQRTREIGVRVALGAQRSGVLAMVLRETLTMVLAGILLGVPLALAAGRLVGHMLFDLSPSDPVTLALVIGILLAAAAVAGYLPARRAARVDPMVALRHE